MKASDLLTKNRYCSNHFNRDDYPRLIESICRDLNNYFDDVVHASRQGDYEPLLSEGTMDIISEIESNMDAQKFKFRKKSVFADDHLVLALFIVPAAVKLGTPIALRFAEILSAGFTEHFPGTTFKIGNYDDIMEGFKWKLTLFSK